MRWLRQIAVAATFAISITTLLAQDSSPATKDSGTQDKAKSSGSKDSGEQENQKTDDDKTKDKGDTGGDTSKTAFDEGMYAQATALSYRSMQELSALIASRVKGPFPTDKKGVLNTPTEYVIYDPTVFASINEYRIVQPQVGLLKKALCNATNNARLNNNHWASAGTGIEGVISGSIDAIEKLLKLVQTETTIKGAPVNITDAALITEVAARLRETSTPPPPTVFYPGQYFEPVVEQKGIKNLLDHPEGACDAQGSIILNVIALGLERLQAQAAYNLLTKALQDIDAKDKKLESLSAPRNEDERKKQDQKKTDLSRATTSLKAHMDATDAFTKMLETPDNKGMTPLGRLATAQRLDEEVSRAETAVLVIKWLQAGSINKTRKNLFFLGSRNYYGAGATALYECYDLCQHLLTSGTVTATARYVHDKTFEKGEFNGNITCLDPSKKKFGGKPVADKYSCPSYVPAQAAAPKNP